MFGIYDRTTNSIVKTFNNYDMCLETLLDIVSDDTCPIYDHDLTIKQVRKSSGYVYNN